MQQILLSKNLSLPCFFIFVKIATWNVNSLNARLEILLEFIEKRKPDIIALQETKVEDDKFPLHAFNEVGYKCLFKGQKAYNGVAIISKMDWDKYEKNFEDIEGEQKRIIMAEINGIKIINAYFPHGKMVGSSYFQFKLDFIKKLKEYISKLKNVILLGDFNVAPEEMDVYNPDILQYSIGFSVDERNALNELYSIGFVDVFRLHNKNKGEYTWWDYRSNSFKRNAGMRIDHIWAFKNIASKSISCYIDKEIRAKPKTSDHAPVVAEFDL